MKITVIGDGAWGTALALLLVRNGHEVSLWGPFPEYLQEMEKTRENTKFLPGVKLDPGLRFTADPADAADTNLWLVAAPTQYMRKVLEQFKPFFRPEQHIVLSVACNCKNNYNETIETNKEFSTRCRSNWEN